MAARQLAEEILARRGERVVAIVLFGSTAVGDDRPFSFMIQQRMSVSRGTVAGRCSLLQWSEKWCGKACTEQRPHQPL